MPRFVRQDAPEEMSRSHRKKKSVREGAQVLPGGKTAGRDGAEPKNAAVYRGRSVFCG